jgi:hypothetical protein
MFDLSIDLSFLYPLYSLDPRTVWKGQLALLLVLVGAAAAMVIPLDPRSRVLRWLKICCVAGIVVMAVLQCALLVRYLFYPSYINHGEALNSAVSWLGWEGYPLYPRLDTGDIYANLYGPVFFQVTGFFLWLFGPSIGASKILGLSAFALLQVLSFATLRRTGAGVAEAVTMTGVQCVVLAGYTPDGIVSGVRLDPLILVSAQTSVLVATLAPTMLTASAFGLLGGICLNLRIDGALFILPTFVYHLSRSPSLVAGLRLTGVAGLVGIIAAGLPFIPSNVSFVEFYNLVQVMSKHPWERWLFEQNFVLAGMLLVPLVCMYALFRPKLSHAFKWFIATLVLSVMLEAFPAAESGAGPHHLLPFLPSVVWGFVVMRREALASLPDLQARGRYEAFSLSLMAALLFGYGPIVVTSWGTVLHRFAYAQLVRAAKAEVDGALDDNQGLKVAVGPGRLSVNADPRAFDPEMLRVIPVFRGNPLPIDPAVWMNFQAEGVSDDPIRRAITECRVDLWVLPAGAPFFTISHYNGEEIFSPQVLADFHANYVKQRSGRIFDQWKCKRDTAASGK